MNNEILNKVDEIINLINESDEYKKYLFLKKELENNKEVNKLINEIKILQKDVVHHIKDEKELKVREEKLNNIPIYREYQNTLDELNNTYSIIENTLNNYFNKTLN